MNELLQFLGIMAFALFLCFVLLGPVLDTGELKGKSILKKLKYYYDKYQSI